MATRRPQSVVAVLAVFAVGALTAFSAASAQQGNSCNAAGAASVQLLILASPKKVDDYVATLQSGAVVRRDRTTVVLDDGRVVTSDVEATTTHLNALGWSHLPIQIVASFRTAPKRRAKG